MNPFELGAVCFIAFVIAFIELPNFFFGEIYPSEWDGRTNANCQLPTFNIDTPKRKWEKKRREIQLIPAFDVCDASE